jgi:hypothetical protein
VSSSTIPTLLEELKYCRHVEPQDQGERQTSRSRRPARIHQRQVEAFQAADQPVMSIEAKNKELPGEFKSGGGDYGPQGQPIEVDPTISRTRNWARSALNESTTSAPTSAIVSRQAKAMRPRSWERHAPQSSAARAGGRSQCP